MENLLKILLLVLSANCALSSRVVLQNNGYDNVLVALADHMNMGGMTAQEFSNEIKTVFSEASDFLFEATNHRAFFRNIDVLVPSSWSQNVTIEGLAQPWQTFSSADIQIIVPNPDPNVQDAFIPVTQQSKPCGLGSEFIQLTANFIFDRDRTYERIGPRAKAIVHEWAHYRWGVFEEYGYSSDEVYPYAYSDPGTQEVWLNGCYQNGTLHGNYSSLDGYEDSAYCEKHLADDPDCIFIPDLHACTTKTSIMHLQFLDSVTSFCDANTHNFEAPNKQNDLCGKRSIWQVMEQNVDFAKGANPPTTNSKPPNVKFWTSASKGIYFLMDVSEVGAYDDLRSEVNMQLKQSVTSGVINADSLVGLATFGGQVQKSSPYLDEKLPLTHMSPDVKEKLISAIVNSGSEVDAGVDLSSAVYEAIDKLSIFRDLEGSVLFITKYGDMNSAKWSESEIISLLNSMKIMLIIVDGSTSQNFAALLNRTSSYYFPVTVQDCKERVETAASHLSHNFDGKNLIQQLDLVNINLNKVKNHTGKIYVDDTLGLHTTLILQCDMMDTINVYINGKLKTHSAQDIAWNMKKYSTAQKVLTYSVGEELNVAYDYTIELCDTESTLVVLDVHSSSYNATPKVLDMQVWSNGIRNGREYQVDMNKEDFVILVMKVAMKNSLITNGEVNARILLPNGIITPLKLKDDGEKNPDLISGDGVYSAYFVPQVSGIYRVSMTLVVGDDQSSFTNAAVNKNRPSTISSVIPRNQVNYCCGSTPDWRIVSYGGYDLQRSLHDIVILKISNANGLEKPNPVTDLKAVVEDIDNSTTHCHANITLQWTSVGTKITNKPLQTYIVYYSPSVSEALNPTASTLHTKHFLAEAPGQNQMFNITVQCSYTSSSIYFSIMGINWSKVGDVSNPAKAEVPEMTGSTTPPSNMTTTPSISTEHGPTGFTPPTPATRGHHHRPPRPVVGPATHSPSGAKMIANSFTWLPSLIMCVMYQVLF